MSGPFDYDKAAEAVGLWWRKLQPDPDRGYEGNRAVLARLRRAGSVAEALVDPATIALLRDIAEATGQPVGAKVWWVSPAAVLAGTLAHLRIHGRRPMAEVLGQQDGKDAPRRYSEMRFTRLIRAESDTERFTQLGRAARRLRADQAAVDVRRLARDVFRLWRHPDDVRKDWTFQYYQLGNAGAISTRETEKASQ